MSITDELRHNIEGAEQLYGCECKHLLAIADRIDAEHQKALDEWKAKHGQMWLKGYSECHAELLEGNETLASDLERCGWIRLPKDADDVPWKVGDRDEDGNVVTVLRLTSDGWWVCSGGICRRPDRCRHHHAPTVEDVLREFALAVCKDEALTIRKGVVEEYAKRLTLAEGED